MLLVYYSLKKKNQSHVLRNRRMNFGKCILMDHHLEGVGAGFVLISPGGEAVRLMYKLEFITTNNTIDYEALLLGLRAAKDLGI